MNAARALVLTAGLGTRLRPLTFIRAKAAVPVNGEPLVHRIIRGLVSRGFSDLVLNLHHKPETIAALVGDGSHLGARVRYSWEEPVLGSAGGPRHALPLLAETVLIVNGDTLTNVDLTALVLAHQESGAEVTMALIPNPRPDKYGGVAVSDDGWVTSFTRRDPAAASFHFIGAQAAATRVFADLPDGVPSESVGSLYPRLIERNSHGVRAFVTDASFHDVGTVDDYLKTCVELAAAEGDRLTAGARVRISETARLARTAVWDDVVIEDDVRLADCVVADRARIPSGACYTRCVIVPAPASAPAPGQRVEHDLLIAPF